MQLSVLFILNLLLLNICPTHYYPEDRVSVDNRKSGSPAQTNYITIAPLDQLITIKINNTKIWPFWPNKLRIIIHVFLYDRTNRPNSTVPTLPTFQANDLSRRSLKLIK